MLYFTSNSRLQLWYLYIHTFKGTASKKLSRVLEYMFFHFFLKKNVFLKKKTIGEGFMAKYFLKQNLFWKNCYISLQIVDHNGAIYIFIRSREQLQKNDVEFSNIYFFIFFKKKTCFWKRKRLVMVSWQNIF